MCYPASGFAGHDEGGENRARFATLIGTCNMNGVEPCACLNDLFTRLANRHLARDIDALMPCACGREAEGSQGPRRKSICLPGSRARDKSVGLKS